MNLSKLEMICRYSKIDVFLKKKKKKSNIDEKYGDQKKWKHRSDMFPPINRIGKNL